MIHKFIYIFKSINYYVRKVFAKYRKDKISTLLDMIKCAILYSASPANYYYFGFPRLDHAQRKTYVTHELSEQIQKKYNSPKYQIVFYDKMIFSRVFSEFYGRKCMSTETMTREEFMTFVNNVSKFIYKPLEGGQGKGIQVFEKIGGGGVYANL